MIYFTENDIDRLLEDDAPLGDLTTYSLDLKNKTGIIRMKARHKMVISGTEEVVRMYKKTGLSNIDVVPSGTSLKEGESFLSAQGEADKLHAVWRSGLTMLEFASGIATRTKQLVDNARTENPDIVVAGTRKHPPYLKKVALKALMAGGGIPHRTGLSDTILVFNEHLLFTGGIQHINETIQKIRSTQKEKKIVVEAHSITEAIDITKAGADVVQVDKMPPDNLHDCIKQCKIINPHVIVIAAGGVNAQNAGAYAKAGATVLVTSWMYYAPPADIKVGFQVL